jgi:general secretion pathway protein B
MSYILDALKKAESERERGTIPGLNSGQANHTTFIQYRSERSAWWLPVLGLGMLLALVLAAWAWRQSAPGPLTALATPTVSPVSPPVSAPAAAVATPELAARATLPIPPDAAKAGPMQAANSTVAHVQAKVAPLPVTPTAPSASPAPVAVAHNGKPTPASAPIAAPIRSASGGIPMLGELPEPMRRQIPALNISGAVFSDAPPEWTLIINDQLMGKGSQVAPDVRLEEINANSAVFNFKGQRFRMER